MTDNAHVKSSSPPVDPFRKRALACIREGRVTLYEVTVDAEAERLLTGRALVLSSRDRHPYRLQLAAGKWVCGCLRGMRNQRCAHVAAVQMVTPQATT